VNAPIDVASSTDARKRAFGIFAAVIALVAVGWGFYWYANVSHYEATDDAYVAGDVVQITSEVPGTVSAVHADDTQAVKRGAALVELDPADGKAAVDSAEAALAHAVRTVSGYFAEYAQAEAELKIREVAAARIERDLARRKPLVEGGAISTEELAHARDAAEEAASAVASAKARVQTLEVQIQGTTVPTHPMVQSAIANLRTAQLALRRTRIVSPIDGQVAKRNVQIGARIAPGAPLMSVVGLGEVWIDANFKEVQIKRLRVGQPVTIKTDTYGSDVTFHGTVAGLAAGSGGAFSLLPPQNASGNWIKIVQRVPVRIRLDAREVAEHPLRLGLSTDVRVDVSSTQGPLVTGDVRGGSTPPTLETSVDPASEARIQTIVSGNSVGPAPAVPVPGKHKKR
jgi:membrane fusion protein (multidrug efflux system)